MLLEFVDAGEVRFSSKGLLVCTTMYRDEIGTGILESFTELDEEIVIFPAETSLDGYRDFDGLSHLFHDTKCRISIDHK